MERRIFLGAAAAGLAALPIASCAAGPGDEAAVKQRIIDWYRAFANPRIDRDYYRSFTTDDYLLLENGELLDRAGDEALLDGLQPDHQRSDSFDFRQVRIEGDFAYLVYFLNSEIRDSKDGARSRRYLESAILRRSGGEWRAAVLHSTKIAKPVV